MVVKVQGAGVFRPRSFTFRLPTDHIPPLSRIVFRTLEPHPDADLRTDLSALATHLGTIEEWRWDEEHGTAHVTGTCDLVMNYGTWCVVHFVIDEPQTVALSYTALPHYGKTHRGIRTDAATMRDVLAGRQAMPKTGEKVLTPDLLVPKATGELITPESVLRHPLRGLVIQPAELTKKTAVRITFDDADPS